MDVLNTIANTFTANTNLALNSWERVVQAEFTLDVTISAANTDSHRVVLHSAEA